MISGEKWCIISTNMKSQVTRFTASIISGGGSTRMDGINKSLLRIDRTPIITRTVNILREISDNIVIATNKPDDYLSMFSGIEFTEDIIPDKGPLSGIHAALKCAKHSDVFICASDMPFIKSELIISMHKRFTAGRCTILIPSYNQFIEPLYGFYSRRILPKLEEYLLLESNPAVHTFIETVQTSFYKVGKNELNTFTNINTLEDYLRLQK